MLPFMFICSEPSASQVSDAHFEEAVVASRRELRWLGDIMVEPPEFLHGIEGVNGVLVLLPRL